MNNKKPNRAINSWSSAIREIPNEAARIFSKSI